MKKIVMIVMTLVLMVMSGCYKDIKSTKGGSTIKGESFTINAPYLDVKVKQGQMGTAAISVNRGEYFKQDVELQIEAAKGISIEPAKVLVDASGAPEVQLLITAAKDAALGEYRVSIKGTPETGEPASTEFTVRVVTP